jgi:hypothetical protein
VCVSEFGKDKYQGRLRDHNKMLIHWCTPPITSYPPSSAEAQKLDCH